jgi:hypothetical protein
MDDECEVAYFGDLARDGTGDFDGDRMTDRQEFFAGTDPINSGSVLRLFKLTSLNGGSTTILWTAVPGRRYRVQYKDNVSTPAWMEFPGTVTATTTTGLFTDGSTSVFAQRIYRVTTAP